MANGEMSFWDKVRGYRTEDINLPHRYDSEVDPRLKKPDVRGQLGKAAEGLKALKKIASARKGK
jgi:hypothetical protein